MIEPHEDDPIIYTTDYGLDIKWGNATPSMNKSFGSGGLAGFPYFTTTKNSTTYTWIVIGQATDRPLQKKGWLTSYTIANWLAEPLEKSQYFKNNYYDSTTPAGSNIASDISNKGLAYDLDVITKVKTNSEIPSGNILCLSNSVVENSVFFSSSWSVISSDFVSKYTFAGGSNTIANLCKTYYNNDTFGFSTYKSYLKNITLKQIGCYESGNAYYNDYITTTIALYFFPLDIASPKHRDGTYTSNNFIFSNYLTASQWTTSTGVWARSSGCFGAFVGTDKRPYYIGSNGVVNYNGDGNVNTEQSNTIRGVRPACVIQV